MDIALWITWSAVVVSEAIAAVWLLTLSPKHYRWFAIYLLACAASSFWLSRVPVTSREYFHRWMVVDPILLGMLAIAAREVFTSCCMSVPTMHRAGRVERYSLNVLLTFALTAASASMLIGFIDIHSVIARYPASLRMTHYLLARRGVTLATALFLLLATRYFIRLGMWLRKNAARHVYLFTALVLISAIQTSALLVSHSSPRVGNIVEMGLRSICCLLVVRLMPRKGEAPPDIPILSPDEQERLERNRLNLVTWVDAKSAEVLHKN
jgi:hypothetical protein